MAQVCLLFQPVTQVDRGEFSRLFGCVVVPFRSPDGQGFSIVDILGYLERRMALGQKAGHIVENYSLPKVLTFWDNIFGQNLCGVAS